MYGRLTNFTLLAPSLWAVVEAVSTSKETIEYSRHLFKTGDNNGFIFEKFGNKSIAGSNLEVLKAMQGLSEQGMAKVNIQEGTQNK
tara:strand:+ start:569 stop:826 length:258 start_codon:yes stop_codon:yes gene_type:complete